MNYKAVLVIGATGRTGSYVIKRLAKSQQASQQTSSNNPQSIFALCRDPSKLDKETKAICTGAIQGNARNSEDIENAMKTSKADLVVVAVGNGDSVSKNDIRTASARALVSVLSQMEYRNAQVVVVSSIGAGPSKIKAGFGIGKFIEFHLRHVLKDHDGQEEAFLASMKDRTFIVRPTALTEGNATAGKVVTFGDRQKCPSMETDREDLADWIVKAIVENPNGGGELFGSQVNVAGLK